MSEVLQRWLPLSSGKSIPLVGVGTWNLKPAHARPVIERAIQLGCRHFDCAAIYENEAAIGEALHGILQNKERFGVERKDLFITSKLWNTMHERQDVFRACEKTLQDLKVDYLDLYLIHWPFSFEADGRGYSRLDENGVAVVKPVPLSETWEALEELVHQGKVRAIGVSNFTMTHLQQVLDIARIRPAANQVETHPYLPQHDLLRYCEENGVRMIAYSSLGSGKAPSLLDDKVIQSVAARLHMTPAQVLLSWAVTRGTPVIPKTSNPDRLEENLTLRLLDAESMREINAISTRYRFINPVDLWKRDCFSDE